MRSLYLIRHAKSSWEHPGLRDFLRPLNDRGIRDAPQMAKLLAGLVDKPVLMLSSPAKRALTTAQYFADAFEAPHETIRPVQEIYESQPLDIMRIISALPADAERVLLFGHNPTLTEFANQFTQQAIDNIPTCGIVRIDSDAPDWVSFYEGNAGVKACWFPKLVL